LFLCGEKAASGSRPPIATVFSDFRLQLLASFPTFVDFGGGKLKIDPVSALRAE
jgi:hypothetical protein